MKNALLLLMLLCLSPSAHSQLSVQVNVDEQLKGGLVTATYPAFDIGTINSIFDGDINSLARTPNINPAIITLEFSKPFTLGASKLLMITDGSWRLETAMTLSDLNSHTGTYHLVFTNNAVQNSIFDSAGFIPVDTKLVRLTALRNQCCDGYVHINEWVLFATPQLTSLCIYPGAAKLLPGSSFTMQLLGKDVYANEYTLPNTSATWISSKPTVATVNNSGTASGIALGVSIISIQYNQLHYSLPALVMNTFFSTPANKRIVKTALVIQDPIIAEAGNQRLHTVFGWNDPYALSQQVSDTLEVISNHSIEYQFTDIIDDNTLQTKMNGELLSVDSMYHLLSEPGWTTLYANGTSIDYNLMLDTYDLCKKSNSGEIDEVWLMGFPWAGYYESELAGQNAFLYNSPPLNYGNSCTGLLPIMGYNFERDWPEAIHSYGHRIEATMSQVYGGWTYDGTPANNWELFASIDLYNPQHSYLGNVHFPANGVVDYDYANTTPVVNYAENFNYFPYLFNLHKTIDCSEWGCTEGGYLSWWYHHIPHVTGKGTDGVLFNWWPYIVDYEEALKMAGTTSLCQCTKCSNPPHIVVSDTEWPGMRKQAGTSGNYQNYFWSNGETTPTINFSDETHLQVTVVDHDGCVYESSLSDNATEMENSATSFAVSLFPTITSDKITVIVSGQASQAVQFKIIDSFGRVIGEHSSVISTNFLIENMDVSDLAAGTYFMQVSASSGKWVKRFVITK